MVTLLTVIISILAIIFVLAFYGFLEYFFFDRLPSNTPPAPLPPEPYENPFSGSFLYAQPPKDSASIHHH